MSSRTGILLTPSLGEVIRAAGELDPPMPVSEAKKFWFHYESNGWKVGRVRMVSFAGALGGWHCRWLERGGGSGSLEVNGCGRPGTSGAEKVLLGQEYQRVLERIRVILNSYDSHQDMRPADRAEMKKLIARRNELRKLLGIVI